MKKLTLCLTLLLATALAAAAQDLNTVQENGNVTMVSRETGPGYTTDSMTIQVNSILVKVICPPTAGCYDAYWVSNCAPVTTTSTGDPGVTTHSQTCTASRPGRCVNMTGHLVIASEGLRVVPDSLGGGTDCNW